MILRYLHCSDTFAQIDQAKTQEPDRLFKIRGILDALTRSFRQHYAPSRFLSLDEMMVKFEGRCSFIQYQPRKPINRGFRSWALCDYSNGYVLNLDVYCGASQRREDLGVGEDVVLKLIRPFEGMGYSLTMDRYFSSVTLFQELLRRNVYATGTINCNRKGFPPNLSLQPKPKRGDSEWLHHDSLVSGSFSLGYWNKVRRIKNVVMKVGLFLFLEKIKLTWAHLRFSFHHYRRHSYDIFLFSFLSGVWQDAKPVYYLTTMCDPRQPNDIARRRSKEGTIEVQRPEAISFYNQTMGGVDLADQRRATAPVGIPRLRRWWLQLFFWLLDCSIENARVLVEETTNDLSFHCSRTFRYRLVEELTNQRREITRKRKQRELAHLPDYLDQRPPEIRGKERRRRRDCKLCSSSANRTKTEFVCPACDVALCVPACFRKYHGQ